MQITTETVGQFAELMGRPAWKERLSEKSYPKARVILRDGRVAAGTMIMETGGDWYMLPMEGPNDLLPELLDDVLGIVREWGVRGFHVRYQKDALDTATRELLERNGFRQTEHRFRYRRDLERNPVSEDRSVGLLWRNLGEVGIEEGGKMMERVAVGDPGHDPSEDGVEALTSYLNDPVLTGNDQSVNIGYLDGEPVAFVCAQVNPKTAWGRITYIGILPEYRGRGLGRATHLHAMKMLADQGCRLYEGGTDIANRPMQKTFERNGCEVFGEEFGLTWRDEEIPR